MFNRISFNLGFIILCSISTRSSSAPGRSLGKNSTTLTSDPKDEYTLAPNNLMMVIASGWDKNHHIETMFREGNLKVNEDERKRVEQTLEWINRIDEARPFQTKNRTGAFKQVFLKCILSMMKWDKFDVDRFLEQVRMHRVRLEATTDLMWEELVFVYNKGKKTVSKIKIPPMKTLDKTMSSTYTTPVINGNGVNFFN